MTEHYAALFKAFPEEFVAVNDAGEVVAHGADLAVLDGQLRELRLDPGTDVAIRGQGPHH